MPSSDDTQDEASYPPIVGSPVRSTLERTENERPKDETPPKAANTGADGRRQRVTVTPQDWDELEAIATKYGLPRSKVYNVAFGALREKLGRTSSSA
jgi:hypothetical protein